MPRVVEKPMVDHPAARYSTNRSRRKSMVLVGGPRSRGWHRGLALAIARLRASEAPLRACQQLHLAERILDYALPEAWTALTDQVRTRNIGLKRLRSRRSSFGGSAEGDAVSSANGARIRL